jgi:hypothetical protein
VADFPTGYYIGNTKNMQLDVLLLRLIKASFIKKKIQRTWLKNIYVYVCAGHDDQSIHELCHPEDVGDGGGAAGGPAAGRGKEQCR